MKPDWDKLSAEYESSTTAGVFDVDCTTDGKELCTKFGVRGYPTIKWGDPYDLQPYTGGRTFAELKRFAESNLKPLCGPAKLELCDEAKKKELQDYLALPMKELSSKVKAMQDEIDSLGANIKQELGKLKQEAQQYTKGSPEFKEKMKGLQMKYKAMTAEKEKKEAAIKEKGLGPMSAVLNHRKSVLKEKDEL